MKDDKIFNNKFNAGEVEYEVFGKITVKEDFASQDAFDEYNERKIQQDIYAIFIESKYYEDYSKSKKVNGNAQARRQRRFHNCNASRD